MMLIAFHMIRGEKRKEVAYINFRSIGVVDVIKNPSYVALPKERRRYAA